MPKVFGLKGIRKGAFPIWENWDYKGPMPDPSYYEFNTMKPAVREEFLKWYAEQEGEELDFRSEIYQYCEDDVNILQERCNAFRERMLSISSKDVVLYVGEGDETKIKKIGIDPFRYNTLAGVCMATSFSRRNLKC